MNLSMAVRLTVVIVLVCWAFLDYCYVRSALGVIQPGAGPLLVILALALLLMIPMVFVAPLWILPEARLHRLASVRRSRGQCPWCGHSMQGSESPVCPECGPDKGDHAPKMQPLILTCLFIWLGAWLLGAAAGESLARLDESKFISAHQLDDDAPEIRRRLWPLWGSLQWDQPTGTARATMD